MYDREPTDEELEEWWQKRIESFLGRPLSTALERKRRDEEIRQTPNRPLWCLYHFSSPSECSEAATHAFVNGRLAVWERTAEKESAPMVCKLHADEEDVFVGTMSIARSYEIAMEQIRREWAIEKAERASSMFGKRPRAVS